MIRLLRFVNYRASDRTPTHLSISIAGQILCDLIQRSRISFYLQLQRYVVESDRHIHPHQRKLRPEILATFSEVTGMSFGGDLTPRLPNRFAFGSRSAPATLLVITLAILLSTDGLRKLSVQHRPGDGRYLPSLAVRRGDQTIRRLMPPRWHSWREPHPIHGHDRPRAIFQHRLRTRQPIFVIAQFGARNLAQSVCPHRNSRLRLGNQQRGRTIATQQETPGATKPQG